MDIPSHDKNHPSLIQIMTTEHYNLQAGRSLALSDANGRAGFFLGTVSSTLIALAFVGNITHVGSQLGTAFFVFALVLFPTLFFLGLFTFDSVLQSAIEDTICVRGISRIRHLYVELAPQMQEYFILPTHDILFLASDFPDFSWVSLTFLRRAWTLLSQKREPHVYDDHEARKRTRDQEQTTRLTAR